MSVPTNVTFDDTQAVFSWAGSWTVSTADDDLCEECSSSKIDATQLFNGTSHNALASNSTGSCTFTGTAIYVYGVDAPNSGTMRFTVDDDHNTTEAHVYDGDSVIYGATLYYVAGLSNGQHTLNFEMTTAPEDGGVSCIDYAVVTHEAIASVSSSSDSSHHSTATSITASPTFTAITESLTTAPTPTSSCADDSSCSVSGGISEQNPSNRPVPPETIIGAVVGGVLGLFLIIGGLLFLWYKRRKKSMLRQPLPFVGLPSQEALARAQSREKPNAFVPHDVPLTPPVDTLPRPFPAPDPGKFNPPLQILPPAVLETRVADLEAQMITVQASGSGSTVPVPILSAPPTRSQTRSTNPSKASRDSGRRKVNRVAEGTPPGAQPPPYSGRRFSARRLLP